MGFDDVRYFSFTVQPAQRVLIISDVPIDAVYTKKALEPDPDKLDPGTPQTRKVDRMTLRRIRRARAGEAGQLRRSLPAQRPPADARRLGRP